MKSIAGISSITSERNPAKGLRGPFFPNSRAQFGIKLGLAGLLAIFIAQWLRLPSPGWSVTTVMFLMLPNYLGGVAEKSVFRVLGTLAGGAAAIFLVGNFFNETVFMLVGSALFIGFCTYFFGGTRYPYAFFLAGLTFLVIVGKSLDNPANVWNVALWRTEEILVGVFSSVLISSVLWPKYARLDFLAIAARHQAHFAAALQELLLRTDDEAPDPPSLETQVHRADALRGDLEKLRGLLLLGSRESVYFKAHLSGYREYLGYQAALLELLFALQNSPAPGGTQLEISLRGPLADVRDALDATWQLLKEEKLDETDIGKIPGLCQKLSASWETMESALQELRDKKITLEASFSEMTAFAGRFALLGKMVRMSGELLELWGKLPRQTDFQRREAAPENRSWKIDRYWIGNAIRGGIITAASLLFCSWVQPPGMAFIPIWAFMFTIVSRAYVATRGDLGVFRNLLRAAAYGLPLCLLVFVISPALVYYPVANLFFFAVLFFLGWYLYPALPGFTYAGCLWLNFVVVLGSFDFQRQLPLLSILDGYIGGILGLAFAAVGQRLLWPLLPQRQFRNDLQSLLAELRQWLHCGVVTKAERAAMALQFAEARRWLEVMCPPGFLASEQEIQKRILMYLRQLARVLFWLPDYAIPLPGNPEYPAQTRFRQELQPHLDALLKSAGEVFERMELELQEPETPSRIAEYRNALSTAHQQFLAAAESSRKNPELLQAPATPAMHLMAWIYELDSLSTLLLKLSEDWIHLDRPRLRNDWTL